MTVPPVEEQVAQLKSPIDRLWWFAQLERGIEVSDLDREPRYGSKKVLKRIAAERESLDEQGTMVEAIDVEITVGDMSD